MSSSSALAAPAGCEPTESYRVTGHSDDFLAISPTLTFKNDGPVTASRTFRIHASGSVSMSVSAPIAVEPSAILAGVKASGVMGASTRYNVQDTYRLTAHARPHTTAYVNAGIVRAITVGILTTRNERCQVNHYPVTASTPYAQGGHVWGG